MDAEVEKPFLAGIYGDCYLLGWDAAIQNDERVLALVAALEKTDRTLASLQSVYESAFSGQVVLALRDVRKKNIEALTQYRESVKK